MQHCRFLPTCVCLKAQSLFEYLITLQISLILQQNKCWLNRLNWTGELPGPLSTPGWRGHTPETSPDQGRALKQDGSPAVPAILPNTTVRWKRRSHAHRRARYSCRTAPQLTQSSIFSGAAACFSKSCVSGPVVSTGHVSGLHRLSLASAE